MYQEEDYLMLSGIQHFEFCRRQWALIHIEQQWKDNYQTTAGELMHQRAHDETAFELRGNILTVRGLRIASHQLGISGQCDVVEFHQNAEGIEIQNYTGKWIIIPVEYKRGTVKEGQEDELQLCAQAMCMEEMFCTEIPTGFLYYGANRRREKIEFTKQMREKVDVVCREMHLYFSRGYTPHVKEQKKCNVCSLKDICLPGLQKQGSVLDYIESVLKEGESF